MISSKKLSLTQVLLESRTRNSGQENENNPHYQENGMPWKPQGSKNKSQFQASKWINFINITFSK